MWRIAMAATLLLAGCGQRTLWTGFVYPDAEDLTVSVEIGRFDTFEQCRSGALKTLEAFGRSQAGAFECGRACSRNDDTGNLAVCAETRD